jgi:hypothetical protein
MLFLFQQSNSQKLSDQLWQLHLPSPEWRSLNKPRASVASSSQLSL